MTIRPFNLGWLDPVIGAGLLVLGSVTMIFGIGCFKAWPWAWVLGVILLVFEILGQLFSLSTVAIFAGIEFDSYNPETQAIFEIIISGIIIYYLFRPQVKEYFRRI